MSVSNTVYLIHASDAAQHISKLKSVLEKLSAQGQRVKITTLDAAGSWLISKSDLQPKDLIIVLLTDQMAAFREAGEAHLKALASEVKQLRLLEIIIDSVPYDEAFIHLPADGTPIRDNTRMDQAWDQIAGEIGKLFPATAKKEPETSNLRKYLPYAAGILGIVLLIWMIGSFLKRPEASFSFKVQDVLLKEKKTADECYQPCLVSFYDESKNAESLSWDMADSSVQTNSTEPYPEHLFRAAGKYKIKLTASSGSKNDVLEKTLTVKATPTADFEITNNGCVSPCSVSFQNKSQNASKYEWDLGNGSSSTNKAPEPVNFPTAGQFQVRLVAYNADGLKTDTVKTVTIKQDESPFAQFTTSWSGDDAHPYRRKFKNTSKFADKYIWQFGDGTTKISGNNELEFNHDFPAKQQYDVVLTAQKSGTTQSNIYANPVFSGKPPIFWEAHINDVFLKNKTYLNEIRKYESKQLVRPK
jgi:PKD repeat protein